MQKEILDYLIGKFSPEVVILHGSRASGKNRENSDWDIFIFTKVQARGGTEEFMGNQLDIIIISLPLEEDDFIDEYGYVLNNSIVLIDNEDHLGERLKGESVKVYSLGKKITPEKISNRRNYMSRTLDRMSGTVDKPELFLLYLGFFYEKALNYWFELKDRYSKPAYDAIEDIRNEDPEYYSLLSVVFNNISSNFQKLESAREIYNRLFE